MKNIIIILAIFLSMCVSYQFTYSQWVQRYNGPGDSADGSSSIAVDASGNVYVTGSSTGLGTGSDYATIKYNSSGILEWVQRYNGPGNSTDRANSIAVDSSGNVYVTGSSTGIGTGSDYATIKYISSGVQQWVQRYEGPGNSYDYAYSIAVDNSGNVYVTGVTGESNGIGIGSDYATIKYSSSGVQQWVQRYNGTGNSTDYATSIAIDNSGNVYVTGSSEGLKEPPFFYFHDDIATIKYNSNGDPLWIQRYGFGRTSSIANSITVDGSGNVYVTGSNAFALCGCISSLTIKYSSSGVLQWNRGYGEGLGTTYIGNSITADGSGNVYVTGSGRFDYVTIKYNSNGDSLWVRRYSGPGNYDDGSNSLAIDGSGNVYVTGESVGADPNDGYDYTTIKYNSNGDSLWVRRYDGSNTDKATSLAVDGSGNIYVTGYSGSTGSVPVDYATIKYNSNGDTLWVRRYNGLENQYDEAFSLAVDNLGNVYVTGYSGLSNGTSWDYATIKYNSNGDSLWVQRYNGPGNQNDIAGSLAVDGFGNVYVTGYSTGNGTGYDYATIKYNSNGDSLWVKRYNGSGTNDDYAVSLAVDGSGNVYVTGSSGRNGTSSDYATIKYSSVPRTLYLTAFIEGFYNNVTNKMIKDTVRVYLRNSTVPYGIVDSAKTVLDSNGNGSLNFFNASNFTPYYIVIKHRNSIETWSSGGNSFFINNLTYNFTTAANKAYGNNQKQIDASPLQFGIYSGDVNQNGIIDASDVSAVDNDAFNSVSGYVQADVNGNNFVDATDLSIVDNNAFDFVSIMRP